MTSLRTETARTTAVLLETAVDEHLPQIVAEILAIRIPMIDESSRPARLPMRQGMMSRLKLATTQTGIPATRLLAACIDRSCGAND